MDKSAAVEPAHKSGGLGSDIGDFFHAAAYGAIQSPIDGVTQFIDHVTPLHLTAPKLIEAPTNDSLWTGAGRFTGTVADFAALQLGLGKVLPGTLGAEAATPMWLKSGITGATFQFLQPTSDSGNYYMNKARDLGISFGTFAAMGATTSYLSKKMGNSFIARVEEGAEGGIAGGAADVALTDGLYLKTPTYKDLGKIGQYAAFGASMGAINFLEDQADAKYKQYQVSKSIEKNQGVFNDAAQSDDVLTAKKQLYNVHLRKVTDPNGERVPTLENPGGEKVAQGEWVAQRLDDSGNVVIERGRPNQWGIKEAKIPKTYQVSADTLSNTGDLVAPTRIDGPVVHVVKLDEPLKMHTTWGSMKGQNGDFLANYDYDAPTNAPGTDYAIITNNSFKQTYESADPSHPIKLN
jgi:hypothetical protein